MPGDSPSCPSFLARHSTTGIKANTRRRWPQKNKSNDCRAGQVAAKVKKEEPRNEVQKRRLFGQARPRERRLVSRATDCVRLIRSALMEAGAGRTARARNREGIRDEVAKAMIEVERAVERGKPRHLVINFTQPPGRPDNLKRHGPHCPSAHINIGMSASSRAFLEAPPWPVPSYVPRIAFGSSLGPPGPKSQRAVKVGLCHSVSNEANFGKNLNCLEM